MKRKIRLRPNVLFYKPQGVPLKNLNNVEISLEEWEALRLKNIKDLNQTEAAIKMHTSQSTYQRILNLAQKKIASAIINGWAIKIIKH
jgi:predicted DNA-binding protein (UPF0251 family)